MTDLAVNNGVILRVRHMAVGNVWEMPVMGKTVEGWTADALCGQPIYIEASPVINIAEKLRTMLDRSKAVTVVLYSDTPYVTRKTVEAAVERLKTQRLDVLELPRGFVFATEYLLKLDSLFISEPKAAGEFQAITDGEALSRLTEATRRNILRFHMNNGVIIIDPANTYIDCDVRIEGGAIIEPYNFVKGRSIIKSGAHIKSGNYIESCAIQSGATIDSSRLYESIVGAGTRVGPFAYLRPQTVVGKDCRIGDFVELKNCIIGDGCKVSHLTYIGDAELGKECNVGCGVVFANYDGKDKHRSLVGERVFIGSNANIVAPVTIEDGAFIAAGSTITSNVGEHALAVARARQRDIPNWPGNKYAPIGDGTKE